MRDGRYENHTLVNMIINDDDKESTREKLQAMDVLIIDEVSMLSQRTFEQVSFVLEKVRKSSRPFGGVQVILSGDFYQLPPIANTSFSDAGNYCFQSTLWKMCVPHHINLRQVHRQDESDLVTAVRELSQGYATDQTCQLLSR